MSFLSHLGDGANALALGSFAIQTLIVFAGNSRLFGILKPGSGWYTNVEMATRYTSLVTPAKWAFGIWGVIYTWEIAMMLYIASVDSSAIPGWNLHLWLAANAFQATWALAFATERLVFSTVLLGCIATSLIKLGLELSAMTPGGTVLGMVVSPVWLHAGWVCAATLVSVNLVLRHSCGGAPERVQVGSAYTTAALATLLGLLLLAYGGNSLHCWMGLSDEEGEQDEPGASSSYGLPSDVLRQLLAWWPVPCDAAAAPLAIALGWALFAIRAELISPSLISHDTTYAAIGESGRAALEWAFLAGGSLLLLAALLTSRVFFGIFFLSCLAYTIWKGIANGK